ncbi:MAG: LCP family protein [Oscillospiraceae bacterium]
MNNNENDTIKTTAAEKSGIKKPKKKKGWSKKKKALLIIIIIFAMFLLLLGALVGVAFHYINKLNIVEDTGSYEILDSIEPDDDLTSEPDSPKEEIDKLEEEIRKNLEENATEIISDDNVYNILLIGTDARTASGRGRSDSMILVSINKNTKKIIMTSFLRDIYLSIPNVESTRLNHAYAYGGADLLIDTIEQNFKVRIDKYAQVNFYSFITVVDSLGGVDINVTDDEVQYVNMYLREINRLEGLDESDGMLSSGGTYTLNGRQALAYSRIRYIGTDFQRTERQRTVLEKLINKMKSASLTELNDLADKLLPNITTNLQQGEVFSLILNSPTYFGYDVVQCRVPDDNTWWNLTIRGMAVLGVDFDANISYLRKNIYGE